MIKWTLIILAIICIATSVFWFCNERFKKFIEDIGPLFSVLASLLAVTIFLQFYNDYSKSKKDEDLKKQEEKARHNSKMVALGSEIMNNIQICNLYDAERENHLTGKEVPNIYFEYSVIENMIINGDITHHKLRAELTSLILQMKSINNLILSQQQVMIFKNFASVDRFADIQQRTISSMSLLHAKTPLIKKQLIEVEPLFRELWDNPEIYITDDYLKNKLLNEAQLR